MTAALSYDQLVFSGGGTRCFWHGGFLDIVRDAIGLAPKRIAAVSGGALSATTFISGRGRRLLKETTDTFAGQDHNIAWHDLVEGEGITPHQRLYRQIVEETIDAEAQKTVAEGPSCEVLIGHPPGDDPDRWTAMAATGAYEAELHVVNSPHFHWAKKTGLGWSLVDARRAAAEGKLADLVCAAATIPPLFDLAQWNGRPVIDGGMADQAPLPSRDEGRTLILLTRRYRNLPDDDRLDYVAPEEETPADKIDFTDPEKIRATWDCGQRDGRRFLERNGLT